MKYISGSNYTNIYLAKLKIMLLNEMFEKLKLEVLMKADNKIIQKY